MTGGYAFYDFFTQNPAKNKESLKKLKEAVSGRDIQYVCTGHSGIYPFSPSVFAHMDESAVFGKGRQFHKDGPKNPFRD